NAPRQRIDLARLREQLAAEHPRHALVADHHRERVAAALELLRRRERLGTGGGADDRVLVPVARAQIAPHRREHLRVVVHDEENGLVHAGLPGLAASSIGSVTRNSVRPGADTTSIDPSLCWTRRRTMSSPRPVPWPAGFVVKNGSKMRSRMSAGM